MKLYNSKTAFNNIHIGSINKVEHIPHKTGPGSNDQYDGVGFIPKLSPKFSITNNDTVFTIGSCFAREIESSLHECGLSVPMMSFLPSIKTFMSDTTVPVSHLLNEYNLGTMLQRVKNSAGLFEYNPLSGVQPYDDYSVVDLFLHARVANVSKEDLLKRRVYISEFYKQLLSSDIIIITLGLIECWYDNEYGVFLNKTPSARFTELSPRRFDFHRMTYDEVMDSTEQLISILNTHGKKNKKILLTVSPVPLEATFTTDNAILATCYSKSVLRVVAEVISKNNHNVDYFPSYEMVTSRGCEGGYAFDNVHIAAGLASKITNHMIQTYKI